MNKNILFFPMLMLCCGNKKGGAWLEWIVFILLLFVLPVVTNVGQEIFTAAANRMGSDYLLRFYATEKIAQQCMYPAAWAQALAYMTCGMSIVYKKMSKQTPAPTALVVEE